MLKQWPCEFQRLVAAFHVPVSGFCGWRKQRSHVPRRYASSLAVGRNCSLPLPLPESSLAYEWATWYRYIYASWRSKRNKTKGKREEYDWSDVSFVQRYNLRRGVVKYSRCVNLTVRKVISGLQETIYALAARNRKLNWQGFRKKDFKLLLMDAGASRSYNDRVRVLGSIKKWGR